MFNFQQGRSLEGVHSGNYGSEITFGNCRPDESFYAPHSLSSGIIPFTW